MYRILGVQRRTFRGQDPVNIEASELGVARKQAGTYFDALPDRLYRRARFTSERERVEHLFALYERMQAPLAAEVTVKRRSRRGARRRT